MDLFLENAQRIFDVARSDESGEPNDFTLYVRPDGGLHFVMESALEDTSDKAAHHEPIRTAYRVTRTAGGRVRVAGRNGAHECVLEQRPAIPARTAELLRDQPLYWISSPVTTSAGG